MLLSEGRLIAVEDLRLGESPAAHAQGEAASPVKIPPTGIPLEEIERSALVEALKISNGVQKDAAQLLSISPRVMNYKSQDARHRVPAQPQPADQAEAAAM